MSTNVGGPEHATHTQQWDVMDASIACSCGQTFYANDAPEGTIPGEPCIACGAPVNDSGAGHDEGCPVMVTDVQIAADMALAAMDNRESWAYGIGGLGYQPPGQPQPRGNRTGAPLHLAAHTTALTGYPVWIVED